MSLSKEASKWITSESDYLAVVYKAAEGLRDLDEERRHNGAHQIALTITPLLTWKRVLQYSPSALMTAIQSEHNLSVALNKDPIETMHSMVEADILTMFSAVEKSKHVTLIVIPEEQLNERESRDQAPSESRNATPRTLYDGSGVRGYAQAEDSPSTRSADTSRRVGEEDKGEPPKGDTKGSS